MFGIDDALIGAVLPSVIGGAASLFGGHQAQKGAAEQQATSAQMAKDQMAFQERMANSVEQRKVADLKAAGLNVGMAYGNPGAPVPSGAMGVAQNVRGAGVSSAQALMQTAAQIAQARANIRVANSQALKNQQDANNSFWSAQSAARMYGLMWTGGKTPALQEQISRMMLEQMRAGLGLTSSQTRATSAKAALDELAAPKERLRARGFEFINNVAFPMFNSADAVMKALRSFRGSP